VLKAGTALSDPTLLPDEPLLKKDLDIFRGPGGSWGVNLSPESGFPSIVVPAGFTRVVYDRVPDATDPNGSKLVGPTPAELPVSMEFVGRPFAEGKLFEIASAYERFTRHRRPPKSFGPLPDARQHSAAPHQTKPAAGATSTRTEKVRLSVR
jgi:hypothetical protein